MITKEKLKEYGKIRNLRNIGFAEKDYFQTVVLFILSQEYGKELVFKGGTALSKCYGLDRFSEDLDFNCEKEFDPKKLEKGLERFNLDFKLKETKYKNSLKVTIWVKGPLYIGTKNSFCKIELDISLREKTLEKPEIKSLGKFLEEVPVFDVFVMKEQEIFAEKIRTSFTRNKARDVYDLLFLTEKETKINKDTINKKLSFYNLEWDKKKFLNSLKDKKEIWENELTPLVNRVPEFQKTIKKIKDYLEQSGQ